MNEITMRLQADHLILEALKEDISSEDVTTNSVMKEYVKGEVQLICKQNGIISGLEVFKRVFELMRFPSQQKRLQPSTVYILREIPQQCLFQQCLKRLSWRLAPPIITA